MPDTPGVAIRDVHVDLGGAAVLRGVSLDAPAGSQLALLGPSGCGKTTLLRVIAGLQAVSRGEVWLGEHKVAGDGVSVAAENRRVGLVFQDWALFPHLSVAANVAYGLPREIRPRRFGRRNAEAEQRISALLEMVGIGNLADRMPGSLSGGQQQRVALARALAPRPHVLLLDEPFSSLDTNLRADVRSEVAQLLRDLSVTAIFVTHDQDEAFVLGDEVAVMRDGVVVQQASPTELYSRPADVWLAEFVGEAVLLDGDAHGEHALTALGRIPLASTATGAVRVLVRPEEVGLAAGTDGVVTEVEYHGHDALSTIRLDGGVVVRSRVVGSSPFTVGTTVGVRHRGAATVAFPRVPSPGGVTHATG
ncbi:MAG: ABC transporter ATP-binding protein [Acidimicrobiales bacterium]